MRRRPMRAVFAGGLPTESGRKDLGARDPGRERLREQAEGWPRKHCLYIRYWIFFSMILVFRSLGIDNL